MWYKRTIPMLLVLLMGLVAFAHEYVAHPIASKFREEITNWWRIVGGFAIFIGAYSLFHMHFTRMRRGQRGWAYSMFVFIGATGMLVLGLWNNGYGPLRDAPAGTRSRP